MRQSHAVLVTAFNRPDLLADRLQELRAFHDGPLFIAIDGPRASSDVDARAVTACVAAARTEAGFRPLEIRVRPENLGCRDAMIDGISWFLGRTGAGMIVEDDIRIGPSFVPFCSRLLDFHKDDPSVGMISGFPHAPQDSASAYSFSWLGSIWGWATWMDRWESIYTTLEAVRRAPSTLRLLARTRSVPAALRTRQVALWATQGVNSWAFWWDMTRVLEGMLTATAPRPLVQHLGGDDRATHTAGEGPTGEPEFIAEQVGRRPTTVDRGVDCAAAAALDGGRWNLREQLPPELVRALLQLKRRARRTPARIGNV